VDGTSSQASADGANVARPWWRSAAIYQVYPRSFCDSNADGNGDIGGIRSHLDYIASLGVDAIWISPWFTSPMADNGYDVSNYRSIDPMFGSVSEAAALIDEAHELGLRVILDFVANHTSDRHPWFEQALAAAPGSTERGRYHFRDGRGSDGSLPPNDWFSAFGGPAWTRTTDASGNPGQWYLHLFAREQPDLNWNNAEVRAEFASVMRFWFDLGVDGLRIDVASGFAKRDGLPDFGVPATDGFNPVSWRDCPFWDTDGVHDIMREFREVADEYEDRIFVGEVVTNGAERFARYLRADELHTAFNLDFLKQPWNAAAFRHVIDETRQALAEVAAPATWVLSSHDETRHVTRFGMAQPEQGAPLPPAQSPSDFALGTKRSRAAVLLMLALPGSAYIYQGEELGLPEVVDLPAVVRTDPVFIRTNGELLGRDGCRVPLPWSDAEPPFGFSASNETWLPQPHDWANLTVVRQESDSASMLQLYRAALHLRRSLAIGESTQFYWLESPAGILHFRNGQTLHCMVNFSAEPVAVPGNPILSSEPVPRVTEVRPNEAVWYLVGADS